MYEQLADYLTLHDIHLLISTLECLYALSSLGETACNAIVRAHGALDSLVSLVTVEAQSYGPKACILMRVVETVPGAASMVAAAGMQHAVQAGQLQSAAPKQAASLQQQPQQKVAVTAGGQQVVQVAKPPQVQQQAQAGGQSAASPTLANRQVVVTTASGGQVTQMVRVQATGQPAVTVPQSTAQSQVTSQQAPVATQQVQAQQPQVAAQQPQATAQQPQVASQQQQLQQQQQQQQQTASQQVQLRVCNDEGNRNFCLSWLRATYEGATGSSIQHEIMYKQYLASLHKLGKRDVISAQHYAACVR